MQPTPTPPLARFMGFAVPILGVGVLALHAGAYLRKSDVWNRMMSTGNVLLAFEFLTDLASDRTRLIQVSVVVVVIGVALLWWRR